MDSKSRNSEKRIRPRHIVITIAILVFLYFFTDGTRAMLYIRSPFFMKNATIDVELGWGPDMKYPATQYDKAKPIDKEKLKEVLNRTNYHFARHELIYTIQRVLYDAVIMINDTIKMEISYGNRIVIIYKNSLPTPYRLSEEDLSALLDVFGMTKGKEAYIQGS